MGDIALAIKRICSRRLTEFVVCSGRGSKIRFYPIVVRLRGKYVSTSTVRYDWFGYGRGLQTTTADSWRRPPGYRRVVPRGRQLPAGVSGANETGKKDKISPALGGLLARALPVRKPTERGGACGVGDLSHDFLKGGWE